MEKVGVHGRDRGGRTVEKVGRPLIRAGGDLCPQHVERGVGEDSGGHPGGEVHHTLHDLRLGAHGQHVQGRHLPPHTQSLSHRH